MKIVAQLFHALSPWAAGGSLLFGATTVALRPQFLRKLISVTCLSLALIGLGSAPANAQLSTFAGNEHHTNVYSTSAKTLNKQLWQATIDSSNGPLAHYGEPLVTAANTVIAPQLLSGLQFEVNAYDGATGASKYTLSTDYVYPSQNSWIISYQPCLVGTRLYYPGAGGTVWYVDNVDGTPTAPTRLCFYGLSTYNANTAGYNGSVFIDTPITADSNGNIFFGFRVENTPVAPFYNNGNGDVSGWARISSAGAGTSQFVDVMTADSNITRDSHCVAPALSNDESTVYVVGKKFDTSYYAYIVGLDSTTLAVKYKRFLQDPRTGGSLAAIHESGTSCPLVGPDGDVYLGCFVSPYNGSRGILLHYSGDLGTIKTPGAFGWDYTPGIVPASMVPQYHGSSSYLLFCKYNNYTGTGQDDGGDGKNTVAILDPNDQTQLDWHPQALGTVVMREVMTAIGCTPDNENYSLRDATREWCVNATAVNPSTDSVFFNSEDGHTYRWHLSDDALSEVLQLPAALGEPYVPQAVGPDGTVYTFNGSQFFAMGEDPTVKITLDSSAPDLRTTISGQSITFTAHVTGTGGTPTGSVSFDDVSYDAPDTSNLNNVFFPPINLHLGTVALDGSGNASITTTALTSDLTGSNQHHPSHFVTASYTGDHNAAQITRIQKIHSNASTLALTAGPNPTPFGQPVVLSATVSPVGDSTIPTGYVFFHCGNKGLGQIYLDGTGNAQLTTSAIPVGNQTITADYASDTQFATSSNTASILISGVTTVTTNPTIVHSGNACTGTVTISGTAPAAGAVVNLSSNNPNVTVPSTVTVTSGNTQATFSITATNLTYVNTTATITATLGSQAQTTLTIQPDNRAVFVSQTVPSSMIAGQSYPVTLVFKNTGSLTWDQVHQFKLASANPYGNTTWGMNRIPMVQTTVAPNANGTFTATVIAPSTPGTYNFQWQPWCGTAPATFGQLSTNLAIPVTQAADAARYISRAGPTTVNAGADFWINNTMKNVGTNTWTTGAGYSMMSQSPANNTTWTKNRGYLNTGSSIAPGQQTTISILLTAPITPGTYTMQWQMDKNGTAFGDTSPLLTITVTQGPDDAQFVSETPIPTSVGPSTTFTAQFVMKNTGTATWSAVNDSLLPIGSNNFGVASIASPSVAPNANGTFPAASAQTFTAPASPGTYIFQLRMADGSTKFGQPTPAITIVVSPSDAAQWIAKSGPPATVNAGSDFWINNTMKNTGITTWTTAGGYSMMSQNPANNTTWGTSRGYLNNGSSISPGQQTIISIHLTAPITPGTYTMQWQMDKSGVAFGEKSPISTVTVVLGADDAQYVSQTGIPTTIAHGQTFNATITMKNLGTATWTSAAYMLKSQNPAGNTNWGMATIPVSGSVAQNSNAVFSTTFTAPSTPGTYQFQWRMNDNGTSFGNYTVNVTITVT